MKKIMLFAAACVALAACNKGIDTTTPEIGDVVSFEKGQQVSLTANAPAATKVTGSLNATTDAVDFKWETGDKIKVTVGTESAEFTLSSGAGTASATFTGTMPAGGNSFNVQYPVTDPDLSTQTYVENGLPKDKMKMTATGCTIDKPFSLTAQNAALRLNLYADVTIGKIVVTDKSANPEVSYTLTCTDGVKNNTGNETIPFFIVIPNGSRNFEAKVYGTGDTPALICTRTTTSEKTFEKGKILNMPLKYDYPRTDMDKITIGTTVWAPVNCGYDSDHAYGLLYQWGRTDGCTYNTSWTKPSSHAPETQTQTTVTATWDVNGYNKSPESNKFYKATSSPYDWYTNDSSKQLTEWPMTAPEGTSGIGNPCPDGWRVPTYDELNALLGGNSSPAITTVAGQNGCYFNGTSSASSGVFLSAAGYRFCDAGSVIYRGEYGIYWSSSVNDNKARLLMLAGGYVTMSSESRAGGCSVRCVQE